jgi:L-threonylcarbamoyladenylate synthase
MKTRIVEGPAGIEEAAALLAAGQVVALPTETVYGLAGHALDPEAAARIFEAKERPSFDPLIVHLPSPDWLDRLTTAAGDSLVQSLIQRFWPGPLTLVLPRRSVVPDIVTAGLTTVAVRMSAHPHFRAVLSRFGSPVAAPSANRFGRISPTAAAHVLEELDGRIPLILDGGPCALGLESTVVALQDGALRLLRAGPITAEDLSGFARLLPPLRLAPCAFHLSPSSPGQLPSHYAPATRLKLLDHIAEADHWAGEGRAGLLAWSRPIRPPGFAAMEVLTPRNDPREAAARLFAAMRRLDALGLDLIVAEPPLPAGLGAAILDRLQKAAGR